MTAIGNNNTPRTLPKINREDAGNIANGLKGGNEATSSKETEKGTLKQLRTEIQTNNIIVEAFNLKSFGESSIKAPISFNPAPVNNPQNAPQASPQNIQNKIEEHDSTASLPPPKSQAPVETETRLTTATNNLTKAAATFSAAAAKSEPEQKAGTNSNTNKLNTSYNVQTGMEKEVNASRGAAGSAANVTIATNVLQTVLYSLMKSLLKEFEKSALSSAENSTTMATVSFDIQTEGLKNSADMIKSAFDMSMKAVDQEKASAQSALNSGITNGAAMMGSGLIKAGGGLVSMNNQGAGAMINASGDILHGGLSIGASLYDYNSRMASATAKSYDASAQALNATQSNFMQANSALAQNAQKTSAEFDQFMQTFLSQLTGLLPNIYQALSGR